MLALVSSDIKYFKDVLSKIRHKKIISPNKTELYECYYNDHKFIIMATGYGKVNIASSLRYLTLKYNVKLVVSCGLAGSVVRNCEVLSCTVPSGTCQFDVDFSCYNIPPGQIPYVDKYIYKTNKDVNNYIIKICNEYFIKSNNYLLSSSDMFVCNQRLSNSIRNLYNASSVDTESGVIGEYCYINNISYSCIKIISCYANNYSYKQHIKNKDNCIEILQKITYKFIKRFYEE